METNAVHNYERKMLAALLLLAKAGFCTNRIGLAKLIQGKEDRDTLPVSFLPCFGYAPSLSRKTILRRLSYLEKKGLVETKDTPLLSGAILVSERGKDYASGNFSYKEKQKEKANIVRFGGKE